MYKLLFIIISCTLLHVHGMCADKASTIVERAVKLYETAPSLQTEFTITSNGKSIHASAIMSGQRFKFDTPDMKIWFDGHTQWTYIPQQKEVNISEPTSEELTQLNPFTVISTLKSKFTHSLISASSRGNTVSFTPISGHEGSFSITFSASTGWPTSIIMHDANGENVRINIIALKVGKSLGSSTFQLNLKTLKSVEIVDLR